MSAIVKIVDGEIRIPVNAEHRTTSTNYSQVKGALRNAACAAEESLRADLEGRGFKNRSTVGPAYFDGEIGNPRPVIREMDCGSAESFNTLDD